MIQISPPDKKYIRWEFLFMVSLFVGHYNETINKKTQQKEVLYVLFKW